MKYAIATDNGMVSAHFGRCPSYTIFDINDGEIMNKAQLNNPGHLPGAIPKYLHDNKVECVICGGMGPRAQGFFDELGINTITGVGGSIDEVSQQLIQGQLESKESMCKPGAGKGYGIDKTECDHTDD